MPNIIEGGPRFEIPNESREASNNDASVNNKKGSKEGGSREDFSRFLKKILNTPLITTFFEAELEEKGLLSELEDMDIIPVVENPNPYDFGTELEAHEKWWEEHQELGEEFRKSMDKREEVFNLLLLGSILGHTFTLSSDIHVHHFPKYSSSCR